MKYVILSLLFLGTIAQASSAPNSPRRGTDSSSSSSTSTKKSPLMKRIIGVVGFRRANSVGSTDEVLVITADQLKLASGNPVEHHVLTDEGVNIPAHDFRRSVEKIIETIRALPEDQKTAPRTLGLIRTTLGELDNVIARLEAKSSELGTAPATSSTTDASPTSATPSIEGLRKLTDILNAHREVLKDLIPHHEIISQPIIEG